MPAMTRRSKKPKASAAISPNKQSTMTGKTAAQRVSKTKPTRRAAKKGFFDLSAELRNRIYEYMLPAMHQMRYSTRVEQTDKMTIWYPRAGKKTLEPGQRSKPSLSTLSRISKQFAAEFRPIYFDSWERITLVLGQTSKKRTFEEDERIGSPKKLLEMIDCIGKEAKFVQKFELFDNTPLDLPGPKKEDVAQRLLVGGLNLEVGQKVDVRFTVDPFGDVREYGVVWYRFESLGEGRGLKYLEVKAGYC